MTNRIMRLTVIFFCLLSTSTLAQQSPLEQFLSQQPDVKYKKIDTPPGYEAAYELQVKQPLDHEDPSKGHFYQKVYLSHKGFADLMVMDTRGYAAKSSSIFELTAFLKANQLTVEHRYFEQSRPDSLDFRYLGMKQVAADLHRVNQLFKKIYTGKWVSTGRSKGGMTTTYYRYFYPNDVTVSVPYVAPISQGLPDKRLFRFFDTVGTADCRAKIKAYQLRMLENREQVLTYYRWYAKGARMKFTYMSTEESFEYCMLEFPFSFWQLSCKCEEIPGPDVPLEKAAAYIIEGNYPEFYADAGVMSDASAVVYYQEATELGYYGFETKPFKGLLKALPTDSSILAVFVPKGVKAVYDPTLSHKVRQWLDKESKNFIWVYGMLDPWTAAGVPPSKKTNNLWVLMQGKHHKNANIANMTPEEKKLFTETLEGWLGVKLN